MDEFENFELTQEEILQLENIEINLLNHSFQVDSDEDVVQPVKRRRRRIVLSESENSDDEISRVIADTIVSRARLRDHTGYFTKVMQETAYELERREWCNLKLVDITQNLNSQMYNWLVNGTVTYTNGFVVSIQKIVVNNMNQLFASTNVNGVAGPQATVRGRLALNDVIIGYDVIANLTDMGVQRYTGDILHTTIVWEFAIVLNMNTKEIEVTHLLISLSGGLMRMNYRPANSITEVLSRNFLPNLNWNGVQAWGRDIFHPIILDIVTNKIDYPEVCFSNC